MATMMAAIEKYLVIRPILRHLVEMRSLALALTLALFCAAGIASSACFQMTTVVSVKGDGSGTIDHSLIVTKAALAQLRNFGALGGSRGQKIDLTSEEQARTLAASFGPDVTYVSSTPIDTPLGTGRRSIYAFTDVSQIRISQQPQAPGISIRTSTIDPRRGEITCALTRAPNGNAVLHINLPELNLPTAPSDAAAGSQGLGQQLALIRSMLAGARVSIVVEPAGQLVATNSPYVEGSRVTLLEANVDQVLGNDAVLARLQAASTPEETKAALKDVPGLKVALDREVTIEFTPAK
jgi:hypothetical protein